VTGGFAGWGAFLLVGSSWAGTAALITLATFVGVASGGAPRPRPRPAAARRARKSPRR
jgi:hypothetical protein